MEIKPNVICGADVFGVSLAEVEFNRRQATPIMFGKSKPHEDEDLAPVADDAAALSPAD